MTYAEFIKNIIETRGQWNISEDDYYEKHHIVPACMGGESDNILKNGRHIFYKNSTHPNCIYLYPEEHFIAHKLLAVENPDSISLQAAFLMMAFPKSKNLERDFEISPEDYKYLREEAARKIGEANRGKVFTPEHRANMCGRIPWNKGLTKETDERMSNIGKAISKTRKEQGTAAGERNPQYGKKGRITGDKNPMASPEARQKVSESKKGDKNPMKNPEVSSRVAAKNRGRKAYINVKTGKIKMFFPGTEPEGFIKKVKDK